MSYDAPPQLGDIPHQSEMKLPTLRSSSNDYSSTPTSNGNGSMQNARDTMYGSKFLNSSRDTCKLHTPTIVHEHPVDEYLGPVAENVKNETAKTSSEFRDLADSRTVPEQRTSTGQPLTHYHSFFYNLLSWRNPRATTLSFLFTILAIFAARYLPALRWTFKALYIVLGITAASEVAGKLVFNQGLASSFRPRKYYTIPRESLESSLEDVEQLINFFVIEFQRVLFAENVAHTIAAFASAFVSYWLIKFVPIWGLSLIATSIIYLVPLVYTTNKEIIDHHLTNLSNMVNSQATQVKDLAGHHTARATEMVKAYAGDYSAKAQEYIGSARGRSASPEVAGKSSASTPMKSASNTPMKAGPGSPPSYSSSDFPHAPKQEPVPGVTSHQEQYQNSQFGGQAEASY